jgi:hypothetical protein
MAGENGLLPNWDADTLIIGTFNPENGWARINPAEYFYGRSNYFWKILPKFACLDSIENENINEQFIFLQKNKIALSDLLISINDADINNPQHVEWIRRFRDNDILNFNDLTWNTDQIVNFILEKKIKEIYFTRSGKYNDIFEAQIIEIQNQTGKLIHRLHTPTGQGLGRGRPRANKLIHRWYEQGGNQFPFLCPDFDPTNFPWTNN